TGPALHPVRGEAVKNVPLCAAGFGEPPLLLLQAALSNGAVWLGRDEVPDRRGDLAGMRLQREVPGIEEAHLRVRDIAPERLGPGGQEERVVPPPRREKTRLAGAEIRLKGGIERDVAFIVAEQIELHLVGGGTCQIEIVERVAVG